MVQNKKRKKRKLENLDKNEKIQKTQKAEKKNIYIYIYISEHVYRTCANRKYIRTCKNKQIENISEHVQINK